jgi:hypothetical protein
MKDKPTNEEMKATKKKMVDFSAVEMEDSWECSLC